MDDARRSVRRDPLSAALAAFREADWTLARAGASAGVHGLHPYPAKFIPHIPGRLLDLFHAHVGGPVLDPFCGSGTTLVEAQRRGVASVGVDLNPIATLASRVKLNPPSTAIAPLAEDAAKAARRSRSAVPPIPRLQHWFCDDAARALTRLRAALRRRAPRDARATEALNLALSRIVVKVSRQESDTRYAAIDREVREADVYREFVHAAASVDEAFAAAPSPRARGQVLTRDIMTVTADELTAEARGAFGMIITSPPYPNAYEYWLYHKYRMYWLDEDPIAVRTREIGARPHYFRKHPATAADFEAQMGHCFRLFRDCTRPRALVCVVVGRSIIHGVTIDNAALLQRAAGPGFELAARADREIPSTRKSFNPAHGTIKREALLVFRKRSPR